MKGRFEIKDRQHPTMRGMRFTALHRAERELAHAVPLSRFYIYDRLARMEMTENDCADCNAWDYGDGPQCEVHGEEAMQRARRETCNHPGGFRTDDGGWECSRCEHQFASYEAWGAETGNQAAVDAVKNAIAREILEIRE